jgi:MEMO1 family protein
MNRKLFKTIILILVIMQSNLHTSAQRIRAQKDTVGFASKAWQIDSIMERITKTYTKHYDSINQKNNITSDLAFRFAICPHDDYTYGGFLYPEIFSHIKARTVIIIGVAHKAKKFGIENKIVFDSYDYWHAPYSNIKISSLRNEIISNLPKSDYIIHDSLQTEEHSVEAFVPFLQYYNRNAEIISILVPNMPFISMQSYSDDLAVAINKVMKEKNLKWGKDIAIVVSTDAVHYGDQDWGGKNYAAFGCDNAGYVKAVDFENKILTECFEKCDSSNAKSFFGYTVQSNDWREYKWTWCGRYSVPFGMLTAYNLQQLSGEGELKSVLTDYSTSIARKPLNVDDLKMGATAIANLHHWVGYAVKGFK